MSHAQSQEDLVLNIAKMLAEKEKLGVITS
jgi:hypothetical protein